VLVAECPEGFAESDSGCHRIVTDILPWSIATLRCQALHPRAHLVAIDNQREQQTLAAIISQRLQSNTPFTRASKRRAIIEQTSSKCIQNARARHVL